MTVNTTNRSHRVGYMVILLALAVALTTALVLAGERNAEGQKKNVHQQNLENTYSAEVGNGGWGCAAA